MWKVNNNAIIITDATEGVLERKYLFLIHIIIDRHILFNILCYNYYLICLYISNSLINSVSLQNLHRYQPTTLRLYYIILLCNILYTIINIANHFLDWWWWNYMWVDEDNCVNLIYLLIIMLYTLSKDVLQHYWHISCKIIKLYAKHVCGICMHIAYRHQHNQ